MRSRIVVPQLIFGKYWVRLLNVVMLSTYKFRMEPLTQQPPSPPRQVRAGRAASDLGIISPGGPDSETPMSAAVAKRKPDGAAGASGAADAVVVPSVDAVVALPLADGFLGLSQEESDDGFKSGPFIELHRLGASAVRMIIVRLLLLYFASSLGVK